MVTYTDNKKLNKPANGEYPNTWDVPVNQDWDIIDKALGSAASFTVGATDITLTIDEAQNQRIVLTGYPSASRYIIIPFKYLSATTAVGGMWIVDNQSNATQNIVTEAAGSVGVAIPTGKKALVYSDGTDIKFADDSRITAGTGLTLTGNSLAVTSPVTAAIGGTGYAGGYSSGQLLIGKADGTLAKTTLTAGTNITITNGDGTITIDSTASGGGGGLSSISFSGTTGLTFTPSTLNSTNTSTVLGGTLGVANGGTGVGGAGFATAGFLKTPGTTAAFTSVATINLASATDVGTSVLGTTNGGTGTTSTTGTGAVVFATNPTLSAPTISSSQIFFGSSSNYIIYNSSATPPSIGAAVGNIGVFSGDNTNFSVYKNLLVIGSGAVPYALQANFTIYSDARTKKDVTPYTKSTDAINTLSPVDFKYNGAYGTPNDNVTRTGLIAQDVLNSAVPEIITTRPYKDPNTGQTTEVYQLDSSALVFTLINAVKELDARVKALEAKVGP